MDMALRVMLRIHKMANMRQHCMAIPSGCYGTGQRPTAICRRNETTIAAMLAMRRAFFIFDCLTNQRLCTSRMCPPPPDEVPITSGRIRGRDGEGATVTNPFDIFLSSVENPINILHNISESFWVGNASAQYYGSRHLRPSAFMNESDSGGPQVPEGYSKTLESVFDFQPS